MKTKPLLLPAPCRLDFQEGEFKLTPGCLIVLDGPDVQALLFSARRLQKSVADNAGLEWGLVAGTAVPSAAVGARFSVLSGETRSSQGYQITIRQSCIYVAASSAVGIFYAVCTLSQLLQIYGDTLPAMRIDDWPDYAVRGVMIDISRDRVPSMATLFDLVDMLASWKINQLQLYTEHTFAYQRHPQVWKDASPVTGEEILLLDVFCRERQIELVPNQNSFGHMRRWLTLDEYRDLAECPDGCDTAWGHFDEPFTLNPGDPRCIDLMRTLYDELLPHFSSDQFNAGLDEAVELGQGRSAADVAERGAGVVYFEYLMKIYAEIKARGKRMQYWGDIIVEHPELVPELPRDAVAMEWGYEADHPFEEHGALFGRSGVPFYVCAGTSSWNSLAGRTTNCMGNLLNAARSGLQNGASGYLITDWGDNGHWQPLAASMLGLVYGAALSWSLAANEVVDVAESTSRYAFGDDSGILGTLAFELADVYNRSVAQLPNGTIHFHLLQTSPAELDKLRAKFLAGSLRVEDLAEDMLRIDEIMARLAPEIDQDSPLALRELGWTAEMMRHACRRGIWMLELEQSQEAEGVREQLTLEAGALIAEYGELWLARSRPGGFADSVARMEQMRGDYLED